MSSSPLTFTSLEFFHSTLSRVFEKTIFGVFSIQWAKSTSSFGIAGFAAIAGHA